MVLSRVCPVDSLCCQVTHAQGPVHTEHLAPSHACLTLSLHSLPILSLPAPKMFFSAIFAYSHLTHYLRPALNAVSSIKLFPIPPPDVSTPRSRIVSFSSDFQSVLSGMLLFIPLYLIIVICTRERELANSKNIAGNQYFFVERNVIIKDIRAKFGEGNINKFDICYTCIKFSYLSRSSRVWRNNPVW